MRKDNIVFAWLIFTVMLCGTVSAHEISRAHSDLADAVAECEALDQMGKGGKKLQTSKTAVCFDGMFQEGMETAIIETIRSSNKKIFVIRSGGGSGIAAARVGIYIIQNEIDVAIHSICTSACANYIFLAGHRKFVAEFTLLAWHGAPAKEPDFRQKLHDNDGRVQLTYQYSEKLFEIAGINKQLALRPDPLTPGFDTWKARWSNEPKFFWTWNRYYLEQIFGVKGIVYYWYPDNVSVLQNLARKYGIDLLVQPSTRGKL